jgi:hypothetical protein
MELGYCAAAGNKRSSAASAIFRPWSKVSFNMDDQECTSELRPTATGRFPVAHRPLKPEPKKSPAPGGDGNPEDFNGSA